MGINNVRVGYIKYEVEKKIKVVEGGQGSESMKKREENEPLFP